MELLKFTNMLAAEELKERAELPPEATIAMAEAALVLMRLGRGPTDADILDPRTRTAWEAAALVHEVERASRLGLAAQGPAGLAKMLSEIDGGKALADLVATRHASAVAAEIAARRARGR